MLRTILIDDEEKSRKLLANLLRDYCSQVEIIAFADSADAGFNAISKYQPDLVFLDIVMPEKDGFELLSKFDTLNFEIIFTTAHEEFILKALREDALDYLLKPIDLDELINAVDKAQNKITANKNLIETTLGNKIGKILEKYHSLSINVNKIAIPTENGLIYININDIAVCKAEGNYTIIYFIDSPRREVASKTLKEFEVILSNYNFVRTHRSYLLNMNHIKEYHRVNQSENLDADGGSVALLNDMMIPVSRDKKKILLSKGLGII